MDPSEIAAPADLWEQGLSFQPVLPPPGIPAPVCPDGQGGWRLRIAAPGAGSVELQTEDGNQPFVRDSDGLWQAELPFRHGFHYVHLLIDGTDVLWPYLPVSYGYSRPCNYVELPQEDDGFYRLRDVPHGKLLRDRFYSAVTSEWQGCTVYLPPGAERAEAPLPVLYLQHGHGENETSWATAGRVDLILDNLIAEGGCVPFAVVMLNGMVQTLVDGRRTVDFTLLEDVLLRDALPFAEERYGLGGSRERRAMAGLSMGSLQTSIIGFSHPELFCALGIFSGFLHDWIRGSEIDMIPRGPGDDRHLALLEDPRRFDRAFDVFFRAMGEEDPFLPRFEEDDRLCLAAGVRQIRRLYPGGHNWNVWRRCLRDFAGLIFRGPQKE